MYGIRVRAATKKTECQFVRAISKKLEDGELSFEGMIVCSCFAVGNAFASLASNSPQQNENQFE